MNSTIIAKAIVAAAIAVLGGLGVIVTPEQVEPFILAGVVLLEAFGVWRVPNAEVNELAGAPPE